MVVRCAVETVSAFCGALLRRVGMSGDEADYVARALVSADARGVASHGVARLPVYLKRLEQGGNNPTAKPTVECEAGATAVVDGRNALGLVVGRFGMQKALELARCHGVGAVSCRQSGHFGAAAEYAMMGPPEGCVAVAMTNAYATMAPWGGVTPLLGNNPIAVAAPILGKPPFVLDMALSTVAKGKIRLAAARGEKIPEGWVTDSNGNPVLDAKSALQGLLTPVGGPKGSALAIVVDILAGLLSGAAIGPSVRAQSEISQNQEVGHFFLALHVAHFVDPHLFSSRLAGLLCDIRQSTPRVVPIAVLAPGDIECQAESDAAVKGLTLDDSTWEALLAAAALLNVEAPSHQ